MNRLAGWPLMALLVAFPASANVDGDGSPWADGLDGITAPLGVARDDLVPQDAFDLPANAGSTEKPDRMRQKRCRDCH